MIQEKELQTNQDEKCLDKGQNETQNDNANSTPIESNTKFQAIEFLIEDIKNIKKPKTQHLIIDEKLDVDRIIDESNKKARELINVDSDLFVNTEQQFLAFLENFVCSQAEKERQKLVLKETFFVIVMFCFIILMVTPFALICNIDKMNQTTAIVSIISVLVELVSAIIVLPEIIAKYLFNKQEDEKMMEIIKTMQRHNQNKHDFISKFTNRDG